MIHSIIMFIVSFAILIYGDRTNEITATILGIVFLILSTIHLYYVAQVEINRSNP